MMLVIIVSGCTSTDKNDTNKSEVGDDTTATEINDYTNTSTADASWDACLKCGANNSESLYNSEDGIRPYCNVRYVDMRLDYNFR